MARFLYFVTAHVKPAQVKRLVAALLDASPGGEVVLHFDPAEYRLDGAAISRSARFHAYPEPRRVRWGDFSLVEAFLDVTRWAMPRIQFDWLIWISGQDYPLGPLGDFEDRLALSGVDASFRHFSALTHPGWPPREGLQRYYFRHFEFPVFPYSHRLPAGTRLSIESLSRWVNAHQNLFVVRHRRLSSPPRLGVRTWGAPFGETMRCVGGWTWLNLNRRCVERIHESVEAQPELVRHYRRTQCPDESFLHTILVNTDGLSIANDPLRHVCWGDRKFPSHPLCITRGPLLDAAIASGMPFARKFDIEVDASCLDILDRRICEGRSSVGAYA